MRKANQTRSLDVSHGDSHEMLSRRFEIFKTKTINKNIAPPAVGTETSGLKMHVLYGEFDVGDANVIVCMFF